MEYFAKLPVGATLHHGTYEIRGVLGQGGFGVTYLGFDLHLQKEVAIKEFFPQTYCTRTSETNVISLASESSRDLINDLKRQFVKEARNIARLDNPNIVRIYSAFEENDTAYYVMDYVKGMTISEVVKLNGPMPADRAKEYINEIGNALEYLHRHRMLHLDVKPGNILIREDGQPILIDFGLSKNYGVDGSMTTKPGAFGLSPGYSPLEQYAMTEVKLSPKSDLYSLAATYYYMLTGVTPPEATVLSPNSLPFPTSVSSNVRDAIIRGMSHAGYRQNSVAGFLEEINTIGGAGYQPESQQAHHNYGPVFNRSRQKRQKDNKIFWIIGLASAAIILFIILLTIFIRSGKSTDERIVAKVTSNFPDNMKVNSAPVEETTPTVETKTFKSETATPKNPYGPFSSKAELTNMLETYIDADGVTRANYVAPTIITDYGTVRKFTRQQFIDEAIRYQNNSLTKLDSQRIYDWSTLKTTPTSDGGVTASFVQTYNKTVDVDGNWVTRQYRLTTEVTFNSAGLITKYKERTKLIDEL